VGRTEGTWARELARDLQVEYRTNLSSLIHTTVLVYHIHIMPVFRSGKFVVNIIWKHHIVEVRYVSCFMLSTGPPGRPNGLAPIFYKPLEAPAISQLESIPLINSRSETVADGFHGGWSLLCCRPVYRQPRLGRC